MGNAALHRELCSRQRLAQHLAAENLRATDVTAVTAKNIVFDTLELQQRDEIFQYRVHRASVCGPTTVDGDAGATDEHGIIAREEQHDFRDIHGLTDPARRGRGDAVVA